ncbi:MAG TPA: GNAT family N-acetyltransferase [Burkholderiales bacterium]|nr:GNAT family N-acetyltransferase [Burkholderiales bacterium]
MKVAVRPLVETDLEEADRVFRLAFGTELGLPEPMAFRGDSDMVKTRWRGDPSAALGAFRGDELIGSSLAARWGSFGVFGPITVRPDCWGHGIGKRLLEPSMALFERWGIRQMGLFTFPQSPKHVALYQGFGFWPQFLTAVMSKAVEPPRERGQWSAYTGSPASLRECAELTDEIFPGLDLQREIVALSNQRLGETVLLPDGGFAACHIGKGSEAGSGVTYIKFGAVRPGRDAPALFDRLITACETLAAERGCSKLVAGVNTARHAAYRRMAERGFRTFLHGVAMQRPNETGYNRADCLVLDDWR